MRHHLGRAGSLRLGELLHSPFVHLHGEPHASNEDSNRKRDQQLLAVLGCENGKLRGDHRLSFQTAPKTYVPVIEMRVVKPMDTAV